jgi:hypothetical protein
MFSEDVANWLTQHVGTVPYLVFVFALALLLPLLMGAGAYLVVAKERRRARDGLLLGVAVAAWASLCWLVVPYCGAYPCLPALAVIVASGGSPVDTLPEELLVHATNFVLWPTAGWLVFHIRTIAGRAAAGAGGKSKG